MSDSEVTADSDGSVHIVAELQVDPPDTEQDEQNTEQRPAADPVADVLGGVARGVGSIRSGRWDAIKPDDSQPTET